MICPFKDCANKEDNPFFENTAEHLVIVMDTNGHIHIHGPFKNEYAVRKMSDALVTEMKKNGIDYVPVAKQDRE